MGSEHFLMFKCRFAWHVQESLHLVKNEKNVGVVAVSTTTTTTTTITTTYPLVLVVDWIPHLFIQFFSLFPAQHSILHMVYIM